jgi:formylglycine-generating enzyme required for sulfatase activity
MSGSFSTRRARGATLLALVCVVALTGTASGEPVRVAVLELGNAGGLSPAEIAYLTDQVRTTVVETVPEGSHLVMTRESIQELLPDGVKLTDCLDAVCEVEIGRMLGADFVISGEVLTFAEEYRLILKLHDCNSAAFMTSEAVAAKELTELEAQIPDVAWPVALRIDGRRPPVTVEAPGAAPIERFDREPQSSVNRAVLPAMSRVGPGEFLMGSPPYERGRDEVEDRHQVTLTRPFLISVTEITQAQWYEIMGTRPAWFEGSDRPVEKVDWFDAVRFCNALSQAEGLTPAYRIGRGQVSWNRDADGYRLPTAAEWEYACRAGSTTRYAAGDDPGRLQTVGWFGGSPGDGTRAVGRLEPNAWGLYDMHGNVWEWVWDWSGDYPPSFARDPAGPADGRSRVIRGGAFDSPASSCRSAKHNAADPELNAPIIGFRVARNAYRAGR